MSEQNELIGFRTVALRDEIRRREVAVASGKCDACGRWYDGDPCGSPRHDHASAWWYRRWRVEWGSSYMIATSRERGLSITIARYGKSVSLFPYDGGAQVDSTDLPDADMSDRARFEWAVDWAESRGAASQ
jgi:hypothetical protein